MTPVFRLIGWSGPLMETRPLLWFVLICLAVSTGVVALLAARRRFGVGVLWLGVGAATMLMWESSGRLWPLQGPSGQRLYLGSGVIAPSLLLLLLLVYLEHGARDARRILVGIVGTGVVFQLANRLAAAGGAPLSNITWLHIAGSAASQSLALAAMSVAYQSMVAHRVRLPLVLQFCSALLLGTAVDMVVFPIIASTGFTIFARLQDPVFLASKLVGVAVLSIPAAIYLHRQLRLGRTLAVHEMSPLAIAGLGNEGPIPDVITWRAVADTLGDGLTASSAGRVVFANAAMARMAGLAGAEAMRDTPFANYVCESDLERLEREQYERQAGMRTAESFEWRLRRPDGSLRIIASTSTPALLGGQRVTVAIHRDVTAERQSQDRLARSNAAIQALVASASALVTELDPERVVTAVSQRARRLVEAGQVLFLERSEADGRLICREALGAAPRLSVGARLDAGAEAEFRAWAAEHQARVIELLVEERELGLLVVAPGTAGAGFVWDEVALLEALGATGAAALHMAHLLRDLRAAETRYSTLFDQIPAPVWLFDPADGRILDANQAAVRRYGWSREELRAMRLAELAPPADRERLEEVLRPRSAASPQAPLLARTRSASGEELDVLIHTALVDLQERQLGLAACVDLTLERRNQERIQTSQRLEALGRLAGGIAHDFNNILTALQVDLGMLEQDYRGDAGLRDELANIRAAVERAADLTRQVLLFSRGEEAKRQPLALADTVREVERLLRRSLGETVELVVRIDPDTPAISADRAQIHSALLNLCLNARDALPRGGTVEVHTGRVILDSAAAARLGMRAGAAATLTVSDQGLGMAADVLQRAMEPFFTTKGAGQGTGLGLSIVHGVARSHEGAVELSSEPGRGTRVTLFFPELSAPLSAADPAPLERLGGRETVLLVDDEPGVRRAGRRMLERFGYRVLVAEHGAEALDLLERDGQRIDLVVTDMVMPTMDARELIGIVHQRWPGLPVILSTGYDAGRLAPGEIALFAGAVPKPYTPTELLGAVRRTLDSAAGSR